MYARALLLTAAMALCGAAFAQVEPLPPPVDALDSGDLWGHLTTEQRRQLWQRLTPEERQSVWRRLTPAQRQAMRERLAEHAPGPVPNRVPGGGARLSPEERRSLREAIREAHRESRRGRGGRGD
jgi:uncharacterized membrane protein